MNTVPTLEETRTLAALLARATRELARVNRQLKQVSASEDLRSAAERTGIALEALLAALDAHRLELPASGDAAGMGLWRGVSEWCEDEQLNDAIYRAEEYFRAIQKTRRKVT